MRSKILFLCSLEKNLPKCIYNACIDALLTWALFPGGTIHDDITDK